MRGKWIVFEGLDGAGTTTQTRSLVEGLRSRLSPDTRVFETSEPTRGPVGTLLWSVLRGETLLDPGAIALLFTADRSDHLHRPEGVLERLERGEWIVMDRYLYSTLAYQDVLDREWLVALNDRFPRPDLVVFLDTPVDTCLERLSGRKGTPEIYEREETLRRIAESYKWVLDIEKDRSRFLILDGTAPVEEIAKAVFESVGEWLPR